jgi:hypothetical protein
MMPKAAAIPKGCTRRWRPRRRSRSSREPDARLDHLPELFPPVRQARRHDRHGLDRGRRVRRNLQARRGRDPDQPPVSRLDEDDEVYAPSRRSTRDRREIEEAAPRASRSWSARPRSRSRNCSAWPKRGLQAATSRTPRRSSRSTRRTEVLLNARFHEQEAFIVAQAGVPGAITIATNMAGRGTDIQLGGNADMRIAQSWAASRTRAERERRKRRSAPRSR